MIIVLVPLLIPLVFAHQLPSKSIERDPNTVLVLFGTRHGNRNPEQFVLGEPTECSRHVWGCEGAVELTKFGKLQAHGLGTEMRKFVGKLVDKNYLPNQAKFYSSSANRCQMTLQAALAGLFTPEGWADWRVNGFNHWSPIPYTIDDPLLRMYAVSGCPVSDEAWKPISEDTLPELAALTEEKKDLLNYIANNTGWKPTISNAADLADNLIEIKLYGSKYPSFIEKPTLKGYTKETLIAAIMEFAENHQNMCANYGPCRDMMGGVWLKHIVDSIRKAEKGEGPKIIGYASHTEVTLAVMKLLGYERDEITTSAGFVIEYRNKPSSQVRFLVHDPNPIEKHVIYQAEYGPLVSAICGKDQWIPLDAFESAVKNKFIDDWKSACGQKTCEV